jgi:hypothetical protein
MDAEIALKATEQLLGVFTAARMRLRYPGDRCGDCGSYRVVGGTWERCDWADPDYEPPDMSAKKTRRTRKPKSECTLTSDISTFISPEDMLRPGQAGIPGN